MGLRGRRPRGEWREIPGGLIFVRKQNAREALVVGQWKDGATQQSIADNLGVTRQRVQQILKKFDCGRSNGGIGTAMFKRAHDHVTRREEAAVQREAISLRKWGFTREQYIAHVAEWGNSAKRGSPMQRFIQQRRTAAHRGVAWEFEFKDWWAVWLESGHWAERGRGHGYCMARYGDSGPYSASNVYICTCGQNFSDSWLVDHPRRAKSLGRPLKTTPYRVVGGQRWMVTVPDAPGPKKHFGKFDTREAAESYGLSLIGVAHG